MAHTFDVFFSICQVEMDGTLPSEATLFRNFFSQVEAADALGYGTAWLAESHLSCEVQKLGPDPVIPQFKGEIGLNTDVLLMAQKVFAKTKRIEVGSAIRSILVNGGPVAHAEAVKSFLSLHGLDEREERKLHLGFAAGRFKFSSEPYGIVPRSAWEKKAWPVVKGKIFLEAAEVFLRFLKGDIFSSEDVTPQWLDRSDFRDAVSYEETLATARAAGAETQRSTKDVGTECIRLPSRWVFPRIGVIPREAPMHLLRLLVGSHDASAQELVNRYHPCGVFNLSITPGAEIERTHERMKLHYNTTGGEWHRGLMPRTVLVFLDETPGLAPEKQRARAQEKASHALRAYWAALEGTLDESRIRGAVDNALVGNAQDVAIQIRERFHPHDRLMLWFDFFNHDNAAIVRSMEAFQKEVVPRLERLMGGGA